MKITEEAFKKTVEQKRKTSLSFILAVYQALDEFLAKEIKDSGVVLACKDGCSFCCYQLVCCTEIEIDGIIRFIKNMPRHSRRLLEKRLKKFAIKWQNYYKRNGVALRRDPYKSIQDWLRRPCPFLNESKGSCDIYPVRIMDCRTATSLTPCETSEKPSLSPFAPCPVDYKGPGRFRFQSGKWANNLVLDEQRRKSKTINVTPIHHWLCIKKF